MSIRRNWSTALAVLGCATLAFLTAGCSRTSSLTPWPPITDPLVFGDTFGSEVIFQAFGGSKLDGLRIVSDTTHSGTGAMRLTVPAPGDPSGGYTGGALTTTRERDLSGYNAITFWVLANRPVTLDVAGLGNDNTGTSHFTAQRSAIPVTRTWTQVWVPIPDPAKLSNEGGMFFFAMGPQGGAGLTVWIDDVQFVNTGVVTNPRPVLAAQTISSLVGAVLNLGSATRTVFSINGTDQTVTHSPAYFTYASSDPSVASVNEFGDVRILSSGSSQISARLGSTPVPGVVTVNASAPPEIAAPTPTLPANQVVSVYSNAYSNATVDTWSANWDQADVADVNIGGNPAKAYTNMVFAGVETLTHPVNASGMTAFHVDLWTPGGSRFLIKLVDVGADGVLGGFDDSDFELEVNATTTPALATGSWVSLDIPLSRFTGLLEYGHIAQLVWSGDTRTVFIDNVYFHN
ncbi:MAG: hypothetical protein ABL977_06755 [Candidatus Eisenbacteria bacterium]